MNKTEVKDNLINGTFTRTERVVITPEQAGEWLQLNVRNRPMSLPKVKRMSSKMRDGEWIFTHQGIGFSSSDRLIDGQHRLAAIIDYDKPVAFNVTWGLDERAFYHTDTGGTRSAADLLSERCPDLKNKSQLCAIAAQCMRGISDAGSRPSKIDVLDFVEWYQKYLVPMAAENKKLKGVFSHAAVTAAFVNAVRGPDEWGGGHGSRDFDTVMLMLMSFTSMQWSGDTDPMHKLFSRLMHSKMSNRTGAKLNDTEIYALAVSAIRSSLQEKTLAMIYASTVEWGTTEDRGQKPRKPRALGGPGDQ